MSLIQIHVYECHNLPRSNSIKSIRRLTMQQLQKKLPLLRTNISSTVVLDSEIRKLNEILVGSAEGHAIRKLRQHRKAKLKVYSP